MSGKAFLTTLYLKLGSFNKKYLRKRRRNFIGYDKVHCLHQWIWSKGRTGLMNRVHVSADEV